MSERLAGVTTPPRVPWSGSPLAQQDNECRLSVAEYMAAVKDETVSPKVSRLAKSSPLARDLLCILDMLGKLEPEEGHRPSVGKKRTLTRRLVTVDRATAVSGSDATPARKRVWSMCGTIGEIIVLSKISVIPVNLTAMQDGEIQYSAPLKGWKRFCPDWQGYDECAGVLHSMDNIVLPPGATLELFLLNHNTCSTGTWLTEMETWLAR